MSALVSIIIPVYNLEDYIENCLNSVLNQTYKNLEIICVDDGSADASAEKINAKAEKDSRIKYIHQANAGVSAAPGGFMAHRVSRQRTHEGGGDGLHRQRTGRKCGSRHRHQSAGAWRIAGGADFCGRRQTSRHQGRRDG